MMIQAVSSLHLVFGGGVEEMIKKTGDGEGTDAADNWRDGAEILASANFICDVSF